MLAEERETNAVMNRKFDEYEAAQGKALSEREAEIHHSKEENSKIKGQRNIAFVISIALGIAWTVYIAYKICKILKVIPPAFNPEVQHLAL
jgi:hypothetical protein